METRKNRGMMKDLRNYSLLRHNTFGIEGCCRRFVAFDSVEELRQMVSELTADDQPLMILGGGSNLLLTRDFEGTVLHSEILGMELVGDDASTEGLFTANAPKSESEVLLRCGSGECWDDVVDYCVKNGWYGAENLSLIPGDVGASAVQNIGAYGVEAKDIIYKVEAVSLETGEFRVFDVTECDYGYRHSIFKEPSHRMWMVTHVVYRLSRQFVPHLDYGNIRGELERKGISEPTAAQLRQCIIDIRRAKLPDPEVTGNAGSFFMNPVVSREKYEQLAAEYPQMPHYTVSATQEKIPAGWMIDQCGWKGRSLGRAGVHENQALVLVNRGGAEGHEVLHLCQTIIHDVENRFGITLHPEVNIV